MTLNLTLPVANHVDFHPRIAVIGVGGGGTNAVNNMIAMGLSGVEFIVANTDAQSLMHSPAERRVQLGPHLTQGLGAGAKPEIGRAAAEEATDEIARHIEGCHMVFITAGMGGGTGTGAAPIIAQAARELGVLTVGVVTKPFQFEGARRMRQAEEGVEALQRVVDTLIVIPNQNLFRLANERTTFTEAFAMADDVLYQGVKGVTDLMVRPGLINLDFADVRAVMDEMGKAMMGTGEASGEDRAIQAAEKAIANPLLDEISLRGARGVLINITGGYDLTLFELDEAANRIREEVDPDANIIVGSTLDDAMEGVMRVSVVATGIDAAPAAEVPQPRRRSAAAPVAEPRAEVREAVAEPAPQPVPAPAAVREAPQPAFAAAAVAAEEEEEPSLFSGLDEAAEDDEAAGDGLPPPAYNPAAARAEPPAPPQAAPAVREGTVRETFVAPAAAGRPGMPSRETMERLQAAVSKVPPGGARPRPTAAPAPQPERSSRFGINQLINRMTGGHGQPHETERAPFGAIRPQPPVRGDQTRAVAPEPEHDPDRERIEIPAFLRRQAN
ncbi:MAG: cell division protein FtsZ [Rhodobacteraceae bacterium]|nr:cell division protein FtsZ [Paracoccaceae bacterium]